jgi:membrane dipeptidase
MNRVGMVVDLSHVSDRTFWDAISESRRPVMVSHSDCRALANHPRNVTDDMLRAIAKNNGVIGLNLWYELLEPSGLGSKKPGATSVTLSMVVDQLDHMIKVAGIDHVGIGTDFEGMSDLPPELNSAACVGKLLDGLHSRGYSEADIDKVAGLNFLRVLHDNETPF